MTGVADNFLKGFEVGSNLVYKYQYLDYLREHDQSKPKEGPKDFTQDPVYQTGANNVYGNNQSAKINTVTPKSDVYDPTKAPTYLAELNNKYALPSDYLHKTGWLESKYDPNAHSDKSSAGGLYQFTDDTAKRFNLSNKFDGPSNADAAARYAIENSKYLQKKLGHAPDGAELYLAHQQGAEGAAKLLKNLNAPAASIVGKDAVINNGGKLDMTAGDFARLWLNKYSALKTPVPKSTPPSTQKAAVTPNAPEQSAALETPAEENTDQYASRGGMIHYAHGGAVQAVPHFLGGGVNSVIPGANPIAEAGLSDEDETPRPTQAVAQSDETPASTQTIAQSNEAPEAIPTSTKTTAPTSQGNQQNNSYFDVLPKAITAGLQGIEDTFGLNQQQAGAVPQANNDYLQRVSGMLKGEGGFSPEEVSAIEKKVDPENKLDAGMKRIAGLTAVYQYYADKGDTETAKQAGAALLLASRSQSVQLSAVASELVRNGDTSRGAKAIVAAINANPDGKTAAIKDGKIVITDERTGQVVDGFDLTPQQILHAASGNLNGSKFYDDLIATATGKVATPEPTGISSAEEAQRYEDAKKNGSYIDTRGMSKSQLANATEMNKRTQADKAESGRNDRFGTGETGKTNRLQIRMDGATKLKQLALDAFSKENDKRITAQKELKQMGIDFGFATKQMSIDAANARQDDQQEFALKLRRLVLDATSDENDKRIVAQKELRKMGIDGNITIKQMGIDATHEEGDANRLVKLHEGDAIRLSREKINKNNQEHLDQRQQNTFDYGAQKQAIDLNARSDRQNTGIKARKELHDDTTTAAIDKEKRNNAEYDLRRGRAGLLSRSNKEVDRINKMTEHEVLGADEAITPKVNPKQAQDTRNIARVIVEGGNGKIYGDQATEIARHVTTWDAEKGRPKYNVGLSETPDGYSMKLPNGEVIPLTQAGYQKIKFLRDDMAKHSR